MKNAKGVNAKTTQNQKKMSEGRVYRNIVLPNDVKSGDVLQIKFDTEGVVYDLFDNSMEELKEEYGYDFYSDIKALNQK